MPIDARLQRIPDQIGDLISEAALSDQIPEARLRDILSFLSRVVHVVEQAFQDVYTTLVDVSLLTEDDLASGRKAHVQRDLHMVLARSHYRDAAEICSRLGALREQYQRDLEPVLTGALGPKAQDWGDLLNVIDDREGRIIWLVEGLVRDLSRELEQLDAASLDAVKRDASARAAELHTTLGDLLRLRASILGVSGEQGLIELTQAHRDQIPARVEQLVYHHYDHSDRSTTRGPRVDARGASGQVTVARDVGGDVSPTMETGASSEEVLALLGGILDAVTDQDVPPSVKAEASQLVEEAKAEAQKASPDRDGIAGKLKRATALLKGAGAVVTATTALGKLLAPIAEWAGRTADWIGLGIG